MNRGYTGLNKNKEKYDKYTKKYNVNSKNIGPLVRKFTKPIVETKLVNQVWDEYLTTTPIMFELTGITQGFAQGLRIGNQIRKVSIWMRFLLQFKQVSQVRVSLLRSKGTEVPTAGVGTGLDHLWDLDAYWILYDRQFSSNTQDDWNHGVSKNFNLMYKGYGSKTQYIGPTDQDANSDRIFLIIEANVGNESVACQGQLRMFFKDA